MNNEKAPSFLQRHAIIFKLMVIGIMVLVMMIPSEMIKNLVHERQSNQNEVIHEINKKWGSAQRLTGPMLQIPYKRTKRVNGRSKQETAFIYLLPQSLNVDGRLNSEEKHRNIFKTVIYKGDFEVSGSFDLSQIEIHNINHEQIQWNKSTLIFGISDLKGIRKQVNMKWADTSFQMNAGVPQNNSIYSGLNHRIQLNPFQKINFSCDLKLNGGQSFYIVPVAKSTEVTLNTNWTNCSFGGAFVTDTIKNLDTNGTYAEWTILDLNRNLSQSWINSGVTLDQFAFGVDFILPVDHYKKTTRSVKYATLLIGLTFLVFFFTEVLNKRQIHPIQYFLIGVAIIVFYTLLLSFSEQIGFSKAYGIAAAGTIALISIYASAILKSKKLMFILIAILLTLYTFIFVIIQMADSSLLFGSIGLFIFVATIMLVSRKVDWYQLNQLKDENTSLEE